MLITKLKSAPADILLTNIYSRAALTIIFYNNINHKNLPTWCFVTIITTLAGVFWTNIYNRAALAGVFCTILTTRAALAGVFCTILITRAALVDSFGIIMRLWPSGGVKMNYALAGIVGTNSYH
jgi:hypothetical protein